MLEDWKPFANCSGLDPDLFFPERGEPTAPAKEVCSVCVVRAECLEYALVGRETYGVWGGTSEQERRRLRRQRAVARTRSHQVSLDVAVQDRLPWDA